MKDGKMKNIKELNIDFNNWENIDPIFIEFNRNNFNKLVKNDEVYCYIDGEWYTVVNGIVNDFVKFDGLHDMRYEFALKYFNLIKKN